MKKFKGFTPDQQFVLLQKLGYSGSNNQAEMNKFIMSNPSAQARMGKFAEMANKRVSGQGKPEVAMSTGGTVRRGHDGNYYVGLKRFSTAADAQAFINSQNPAPTPPATTTPTAPTGGSTAPTTPTGTTPTGETTQAPTPPPTGSQEALDAAQQNYADTIQSTGVVGAATSTAATELGKANAAFNVANVPSAGEATATSINNPASVVTPANVAQIAQSNDQLIAAGTGSAGATPQAQTSTVDQTAQAQTPDKFDAAQIDATQSQSGVNEALQGMEAATAQPSEKATVQGQLESLMADFEGDATPPWASGAMRKAMAVMQQRGMGASSMAGAAVVQAAMESAIAIASQDAATQAQFEMQNLNNQQQTAVFKTQQRIASIFTDQAADNAAKQFNAANKTQVDQFFADMQSTVARFNADQVNSIRQFNAGQTNAQAQFNASIKAAREEFNAKNDLIIAQANTKWRQDIATMDTAAQNAANMDFAKTANGLTARALDQIWQQERDIMNFAFAATESSNQRKHELLMANKQISAAEDASTKQAIGYLAGRLLFG